MFISRKNRKIEIIVKLSPSQIFLQFSFDRAIFISSGRVLIFGAVVVDLDGGAHVVVPCRVSLVDAVVAAEGGVRGCYDLHGERFDLDVIVTSPHLKIYFF